MGLLIENNKLVRTLIVNTFDLDRPSRNAGGPIMYEYLLRSGHIKKDDEQTKKHFKTACEFHKKRMDWCMIPESEYKTQASILNHTKSLIVDDFLNDLKAQGKDVRELWIN